MTEKKYGALDTLGTIYFIAGILVIIIGIVAGMVTMLAENFWRGLLYAIVAALVALPLLAFGNLVDLLINLEKNTHQSSEYLRQLIHGKDKGTKK